jgi:hypothetical protein
LASVSCASAEFCAGVGFLNYASALTYNGTAWSAQIPITSGGTAISCPTTTFCAVGSGSGDVLYYQDGTWSKAASVDPGRGFISVSCTSPAFCAAVDGSRALVDLDGHWSVPAKPLDINGTLDSVSCPTSTRCVAVDSAGDAYYYDGSGWLGPQMIDAAVNFTSVSCPTVSFCAAGGQEPVVSPTKAVVATWAASSSGAGIPDARTSTVVASPTDTLAGPKGGSQVTVTLKDSSGAALPGKAVTLTGVGWPYGVKPQISPASATTASNGTATFTVTSADLGSGAFKAEDTTDSVTLSSQAKVSFLSPDVPDDADSSVAASPTSVPADGTSEATVTVTLMDIGDKPIARMGVYLYQSGPGNKSLSGAALTRIKPFPVGTPGVGEATSDSSGVATFTVTSGQAETVVYRAEVVFAAPGGTVSGENGPQTRTVGKATVIFITP